MSHDKFLYYMVISIAIKIYHKSFYYLGKLNNTKFLKHDRKEVEEK